MADGPNGAMHIRKTRGYSIPRFWFYLFSICFLVYISSLTSNFSDAPSPRVLEVHERKRNGPFRVTISVITFNRPAALSRLLRSLSVAHYGEDKVDLFVNIEAGAPDETSATAESFIWTHGAKHVRARVSPSGLVPAVVESWFPSDDGEYGLLLEDDLEVSPYFYIWLRKSFFHLSSSQMSEKVFGISLYTPRVIETVNPYVHFRPDIEFRSSGANAYMHQLPCSWGALQFPKPWTLFHRYMFHRLSFNESYMLVSTSTTNGWKKSWKKFYIEFAFAKGMFMLYPNFLNQSSFSTNHLEAGVHISKKKDTVHSPDNYTVPLYDQELLDELWGKTIPILDVFNQEYNQDADQVLLPRPLLCASILNGYVGTQIGSRQKVKQWVGNKLETGFQIAEGSSLVSLPQRDGDFKDHYFMGALQNSVFTISMYKLPALFIKDVVSFGFYLKRLPWSTCLQLTQSALRIVKAGCSSMDASELCKPFWQLPLNTSSHTSLHLRSDGNLVLNVGCGCSNEMIWQSSTSTPGFSTIPIVCYGSTDHRGIALVPGMALKSSSLNTLKSGRNSFGQYSEAVMQSDGNFVVYMNPSEPLQPLFNIPAMQPQKAPEFTFSFTIAVDGNLIIRAGKEGRSSIIWQSGFHGYPNISHVMVLGPDGSLNVYQGYSLCELGARVWSNAKTMNNVNVGCPRAAAEQEALLCEQASLDVYQFFSDPETLTVLVSTIGAGERATLLKRMIVYLSEISSVSCILVVWHKPFQPCPRSSVINGKLVTYLRTVTDSLNNRFYPSVHITTEAVLVLDDDISVHREDIELLFSTWKLFKDKIAGFFPRWYSSSGGLDKYMFQSENNDPDGYPIMLTKAMLLHKNYLYQYNCGVGRHVQQIVDNQTNCEDLAMNFVVAALSGGPSSIYVKPFHSIGDYGKFMPGSLQKRGSHQGVRSDCLQQFENIYNMKLPGQVKAAYGTRSESTLQVHLNHTYGGVVRHHIDCSMTVRAEGCWL